jgi:hypothetical protein
MAFCRCWKHKHGLESIRSGMSTAVRKQSSFPLYIHIYSDIPYFGIFKVKPFILTQTICFGPERFEQYAQFRHPK